ncbi:MAG: protein kinase [Ilumatobacter sp.]|nr:protein kinase [Ilumatobacter sp.]
MLQIDGFDGLRPIGHGGLGDVYRAERTSTGGTVAIKVLRDVSDSSVAWHRTQRELTALVALSGHAHVVRLIELLDLPTGPALVMEYAPGGSVANLLAARNGDVLSVAEVVLIGRQAADALDAAHDQDIVHRDVKPQNLLIDAYGQVKLCDFGIASLTRSEEFRTRTSAISMRYASPEDLDEDAEVGPPSDVYSLGATLLHLTHGAPPTLKERLAPWNAPATDDAELAALDTVIASCLHPDPVARPSAADVLHRLEEVDWTLPERCRALPVVPPTPDVVDVVDGSAGGPSEPAMPNPVAVPAAGLFGDDTSAPTVLRDERPRPVRPPIEPTRGHRWPWAVAAVAVAAIVGVGLALVLPDDADAPDAPVDAGAEADPTVATAAPTTVATTAITEPEAAAVSFVDRPDGIAELGGDDIVWPLGPVGECLVLLPDSVELTPIGCDEPHDLQRITVASLPAEEYPPGAPFEIDVLRATTDDLCRLAFAEFVGIDAVESELSVAVTRPSADTWAEGDRALQCLVGVRDARLVGDAAGSGQ